MNNTEPSIKPGVATFLDFPSAIPVNLPGAVAVVRQVQLRGVVIVESSIPGTFAPPCWTTLEVFDNASGKTTAVQSLNLHKDSLSKIKQIQKVV